MNSTNRLWSVKQLFLSTNDFAISNSLVSLLSNKCLLSLFHQHRRKKKIKQKDSFWTSLNVQLIIFLTRAWLQRINILLKNSGEMQTYANFNGFFLFQRKIQAERKNSSSVKVWMMGEHDVLYVNILLF